MRGRHHKCQALNMQQHSARRRQCSKIPQGEAVMAQQSPPPMPSPGKLQPFRNVCCSPSQWPTSCTCRHAPAETKVSCRQSTTVRHHACMDAMQCVTPSDAAATLVVSNSRTAECGKGVTGHMGTTIRDDSAMVRTSVMPRFWPGIGPPGSVIQLTYGPSSFGAVCTHSVPPECLRTVGGQGETQQDAMTGARHAGMQAVQSRHCFFTFFKHVLLLRNFSFAGARETFRVAAMDVSAATARKQM